MTLSPEQIADMRRRHQHGHTSNPRRDYCYSDNQDWPCDVVQLLDAFSQTPEQMLREFHGTKGIHDGFMPDRPTTDVPDWVRDFRIDLLTEEVGELVDALRAGDLVKIADGIADVTVAATGTAVPYGIPADACLAEVHRSNMTKVNLPGVPKLVKGPGYEPPRIAEIIGKRVTA